MMPTSGCGPFRRFILGSVTAKVLHDVACPVWTGEHVEQMPAVSAGGLRTILCAVDLRQDSERVLRWAAGLALRAGAELTVAHAIPSLDYTLETYYIEADLRRFLVGQARDKIARMLACAERARGPHGGRRRQRGARGALGRRGLPGGPRRHRARFGGRPAGTAPHQFLRGNP